MRLQTLAPAALVLIVLAGPPARAAGPSHHVGSCGYATTNARSSITGDGTRYEGKITATVALYSDSGLPVSATVKCYVTLNGVAITSTTLTVPAQVVAVGQGDIAFTVQPSEVTALCTEIDYLSDATPTEKACRGDLPPLGPEAVGQLCDEYFGDVHLCDPIG